MTHRFPPIIVNNNNIGHIINNSSSSRISLWGEAPRRIGEMSLRSLETSLSSRRLRNNSGGSSSSSGTEDDHSNGNTDQQWRSNALGSPTALRFRSDNVLINSIINNSNRATEADGTRRRSPAVGVCPDPVDGDHAVPSPTPSPSPEPMLWSPFSPEACPSRRSLQPATPPDWPPSGWSPPAMPRSERPGDLRGLGGPRGPGSPRDPGSPRGLGGLGSPGGPRGPRGPGLIVVPSPPGSPRASAAPRKSPPAGGNANIVDTDRTADRTMDRTTLSMLLLFHNASGASVVAIDNKIEQAMDLVKSHLMFAVREEVEVLKDQIKELVERNSHLERENSALKGLASPEQLRDIQAQLTGRQQRAIGGAPSSLTP
ncbi:TSC22 domain family protein 1-like isoform X2 [Lethenteron reissneri]|uniref:TSC22 domain family protein 1-like isoform X2 n=1 Tax=Lethenteron reissneri TaxID=7753 RepID=UPI002AB6CFF5|nr:TSC22 domain family protein 1-like isoform X2 [Lethenteron reissneri]